MADQCIVCLEELDLDTTEQDIPPPELHSSAGASGTATIIEHPSNEDNQLPIAVIQACGHILHDECLREWSQKANSCPICRQQFNLVEVHDTINGPIISTYTVENKKQVAEFDVAAWIEEHEEDEEAQVCPVCGSSEEEEVLLLCDGCDAAYHTHCVGLERVPHGQWYCMECEHEGASIRPSPAQTLRGSVQRPRRQPRAQRTQAQVRRARQRSRTDAWQGAWNQISARIWDATDIDIDYDDDDNSLTDFRLMQRRTAHERREFQQWQQRIAIASRQGAREIFSHATLPIIPAREEPTPKESEEEKRAWEAYDREREREEGAATPSSGRKRKTRSATASPRELESAEPERKLKRPRTRRAMDHVGSASDVHGESSRTTVRPAATSPTRSAAEPAQAAPSFLSSLLKEVEMSTTKDEDGNLITSIHNAGSPSVEHSSPALSPATSNYSTPRAMSLTPPPLGARRSGSPMPLSSRIEPNYSPSEYSPNRNCTMDSASNSRPNTPPIAHIRQPRPQRPQRGLPRSHDSSPTRATMSVEAKEGINRIVRHALEPHYKKPAGITKEQYADINRVVSRKLYDKIVDPEKLDDEAKSKWEKIAVVEVKKAVDGLAAC